MAKYLYGASVQGIQSFIFQTNKLKEIVGASELVERISKELFINQIGKEKFKDDNLILAAAGNIKYIFDNKDDCEEIVLKYPKLVMESAPGITISQAVVPLDMKNPVQELEKRLRIQRNRVSVETGNPGWMVTETARRTGGTGVGYVKNEVIDLAQKLKLDESVKGNKKLAEKVMGEATGFADLFPFDISEMVKGEENKNWIAVIHADGNNLGNKIMEFGSQLQGENGMKAFKVFSELLNKSTINAARKAYDTIVSPVVKKEKLTKVPFRPVVLGGDDFTGIIRGDLALAFTQEFLIQFEDVTKDNYSGFSEKFNLQNSPFLNGLTACAGIAFIKVSYPFHYGVKLAESLCQEAKKHSKVIDISHSPSSLMFHKVQSSFTEEYEDIVETELKASNNVYFNYGPYFIKNTNGYASVENLQKTVMEINRKNSPKSGLRNWLNELKNNSDNADQQLKRIADLNANFKDELYLANPFPRTNGEKKYTPIYDALSLSNIIKD